MSRYPMNKKGTIIPLETLLGILIALLVFGTLWWGVSKFFRLSGQAESNFYDLADKIKDINGKPEGTKETFISIQDKNTFLVLFPKSFSQPVIIKKEFVSGADILLTRTFSYPAEQCQGEACLCLCREYVLAEQTQCPRLRCEPLVKVSVTEPWINIRENDDLRRVPLTIEKQATGQLRVSGGNVPDPIVYNQPLPVVQEEADEDTIASYPIP